MIKNPVFCLIAVIVILILATIPQHSAQLGIPNYYFPWRLIGFQRHTVERIFYLLPIIYATTVISVRAGIITSIVSLCLMLPRAVIFSPTRFDSLFESLMVVTIGIFFCLYTREQVKAKQQEEHKKEIEIQARTELAKAYEHLKEIQQQLIHAERLTALGQLAASVAHEVNNPIAGILIYTQLLAKKISADNLDKDKALEYLSTMESNLIRTGGIIHSLLDFARQTEPSITLVQMNNVIDQSLKLVTNAAELQHVSIIKKLHEGLPAVMADFNQLQQVLTNLMINAIEAMQHGGTLTLRTYEENAGFVKVDVEDTGIGISSENMQKLFTPFFSTKKAVKGVGLGLAISYGIVQRHGGTIEVQSEQGKGSTFTVSLKAYSESNT